MIKPWEIHPPKSLAPDGAHIHRWTQWSTMERPPYTQQVLPAGRAPFNFPNSERFHFDG